MNTYNFALALEDMLPVLLGGLGFFWLARMTALIDAESGKLTYIGAALIVGGGLTKVIFKLIAAATQGETLIGFLDNTLFWMLAPGFVNVAWGIYAGQRIRAGNSRPPLWLPLAISGVVYFVSILTITQDSSGRTWFFLLLTLTTVANVIVAILLITQARRSGLTLVAALFLINIIFVFVLTGAASALEQTVATQWVEQILNTFSQGAFAYASWQLLQSVLVGDGAESGVALAS